MGAGDCKTIIPAGLRSLGHGEAAAGVPAHVPPGVHRPVAARPLDMPSLPVQRLRTAAGPSSMMTFFILPILLAV